MTDKELEDEAIRLILKETNESKIRAEIGGAAAWSSKKPKGFDKRFVSNIMHQTASSNRVIENQQKNKTDSSTNTDNKK